ncbi:MAG: hypothetical protein AABZ50_08985 [Pseudomonadota bacterium]
MGFLTEGALRRMRFWGNVALAVLLGLPVALSLLIAAANCCDETPTPEVISASEFKIDDIPPEKNSYYALVGMIAPAGKDPHAWGREIVRSANEYHALPEHLRDEEGPRYMEMINHPRRFRYRNPFPPVETSRTRNGGDKPVAHNRSKQRKDFCPENAVRCLPEYARQAALIDKAMAENRELIARYRSQYRYPHFREMIIPELSSPLPRYAHLPHDLVRAVIGREAVRGNDAGVVRALAEDTRYWRLVLREGRHLLSKMIAAKYISDNARLASEIISSRPLTRPDLDTLGGTFAPLDADELSLQSALHAEFASARRLFSTLLPRFGTTECWERFARCMSSKLVYQPDATVNLMYMHYKTGIAATRLPGPEYTSYMENRPPRGEFSLWRWHLVYNPAGKYMMHVGRPLFEGYSGRLRNLDGLLRLVQLRIDIRIAALPDSKIEALLAASRHKDPYTNKPMKWDARTRSIYFMGMRRSDLETPPLLSERFEIRLN